LLKYRFKSIYLVYSNMYNYNLDCTYRSFETDRVISSEDIYRKELLTFLNLKDLEDLTNNSGLVIGNIYNSIKDCSELIKLAEIVGNKYMSTDKEIGFTILFSYDYFDSFQICLKDYFTLGYIESEHLEQLSDLIKK
jgi:hypothetical protein